VLLLRGKTAAASLQCLDEACETPELIWTAEMQLELRSAVAYLLSRIGSSSESWMGRASGVGTGVGVGEGGDQAGGMFAERPFYTVPDIPSDYTVRYRQLGEEIIVGGVYIRLYMKQPTFRLSNPIFFLERLVELWEHSFSKQVPVESSSLPRSGSDDRGSVILCQYSG
jgi:hypothetical protein